MGTSQRSAVRFIPPLGLLIACAAPLACYKPAIVDGGLKCNLDGGGQACPDGFVCGSDGKCWRHPDGGRDVISDGSDATDIGDAPSEQICFQPVAGCTPATGMCDPTCQTGCGCREKCSVNTAGALTCKQLAPGQVRTLGQPCQIQNAGTANQIDPCAPGLVCREDSCSGAGSGRCYQFCRADNECTNAPCNVDVGGGFKVCDVPYHDCVPLAASANTGCNGGALACYLATTDPSKTICDCEFPPGLGEGDVRTRSRECNPGLVCVDVMLQGTKQCTRVCRLTVPTDCFTGTCHVYMQGGVMNATYGYCL